jgi:hypothetical protein
MGSSSSKVVVNNQTFSLSTKAHIVRNGKDAPPITKEAQREIYMYLNCDLFKNQLQDDINKYFEKEHKGVIRISVYSAQSSESMSIVTLNGVIRVIKPHLLTKAFTLSNVKQMLRSIIPRASKTHKFPIKSYGNYLGPSKERIGFRFYKITSWASIKSVVT